MKKMFLLQVAMAFMSSASYGQATNTFPSAGSVGIGTLTPNAKLSIEGNMTLRSILTNKSARPVASSVKSSGEFRGVSATSHNADDGFLRLSAGAGTNAFTLSYIDISGFSTLPDMNTNIVLGTNGVERVRIAYGGNVGIGTSNPTDKLSVKGKIRAQEIKVENTNWPDYVFDRGYKLPTLRETEQFIKEKRHLPGIPSAEEVKSSGIDLGDMNARLLQKIEELTLNLIELEKTVVELQGRINN